MIWKKVNAITDTPGFRLSDYVDSFERFAHLGVLAGACIP